MIRFLRGIFHPSSDGSAIIETDSGVGFRINIPANSGLYKNVDGDEVSVYTSMQVREDAVNLYGFTSMEDLELFELLITVNGVGAKAGLSVMSALAPAQLRMAITSGDAASITKANGIGKKTAERIILELKDKVGAIETDDGIDLKAVGNATLNSSTKEAVAALVSLGYTQSEASLAVGRLDTSLSTEELIKQALKQLARGL